MLINRAYKTELNPNQAQTVELQKHIDSARYVYNWALATRKKAYEDEGKTLNAFSLNKLLTELKQDNPWLYETSVSSQQAAIRNLCKAYDNFFRRVKQQTGKPGFPRFKSRYQDGQSFTLYGNFHIETRRIKLPKIGWVRLKENGYLPTCPEKIFGVNVSNQCGRWFVSVQVEETIESNVPAGAPIGVDCGVKSLAVCSDGTVFENTKALHTNLRKLARLQRSYARKKRGSENKRKAAEKIARLHMRIANLRKDATHKATTSIIKGRDPIAVGIEDLNVAGMLKNGRLARAISDANIGEFLRQIRYKAQWNGTEVVTADRWYPSSKTCSYCGAVKSDLTLGERTYVCSACGFALDRDLNAAINLSKLAAKSTESINACGEGSADAEDRVKLPSVKQESSQTGETKC